MIELEIGKNVKLSTGEVGKIVGSYESVTGTIYNVRVGNTIVERNVPLEGIAEVVE